ncbi:RAP domain-containing protein [Haematococcus lacustris]|uniref:RAP domain-containing protein n=1 Tax=Haematococcus lacustris TaxID=44745 RepID=A0A699ZG81_HAELA|nr:RAP domain-containing protein [Haematococcus lacustris]
MGQAMLVCNSVSEYLPKYFNTYIHTRSGGNHISNMQRDVFRTLQALGAEPQMEVPIMQGLFVVDIMAQWRGRQVVVEVDGPMHFSSNAPRHPLCSTVARDR